MEYGFLSLVPPLLTIILALVTKNVFVSLFIGIMTGSFVLNAFAPLASFNAGIYAIVDSMSQGNTIIIASCLIVGAVIHLMEKSGGIDGFVNVSSRTRDSLSPSAVPTSLPGFWALPSSLPAP